MPRLTALLPLLLVFGVLVGGCSEPPSEVDVYQVRGVVMGLPEAGNPTSSLMVHHEAIPSFIGYDGVNAPMPEMTMGFPTADGVSLDGLAVGDKIEIRMEVTRGDDFGYEATAITPLDRDIELQLGPKPAGDTGDTADGDGHAGHDHATH